MTCTKSPRYDFSTTCLCSSCVQTRAAHVERIRALSRARIVSQRETLAAARRAAPPNWTVVDRILAYGWQPDAQRKERRAAVEYMLGHGHSQRATAEKVGISTKSVERIAARMREDRNERSRPALASASPAQP